MRPIYFWSLRVGDVMFQPADRCYTIHGEAPWHASEDLPRDTLQARGDETSSCFLSFARGDTE